MRSFRVYRNPLVVRVTHWLSALALLILTMSGMQIFNAHAALYASDASDFAHPAFAISGGMDSGGNPQGFVQFGSKRINTTHVLGWGPNGYGEEGPRAFPGWATMPPQQDLANGRRWHIAFAWIFVLCGLTFAPWALRLWPSRADLHALPHALRTHLLPWKVAPSAQQNPLQKLTYFGLVFIVVPIAILSGLALAPAVDSWAHFLPAVFGGRQFARIWHFAAMFTIIAFFVGHVGMVVLTGLVNNMRSMITGWLVVPQGAPAGGDTRPSAVAEPVAKVTAPS